MFTAQLEITGLAAAWVNPNAAHHFLTATLLPLHKHVLTVVYEVPPTNINELPTFLNADGSLSLDPFTISDLHCDNQAATIEKVYQQVTAAKQPVMVFEDSPSQTLRDRVSNWCHESKVTLETLNKGDWGLAHNCRTKYDEATQLVVFLDRCFHRGFSLKCKKDAKVIILATDVDSYGQMEVSQTAGRASRAFGIGAVDVITGRDASSPPLLRQILLANDRTNYPVEGSDVLLLLRRLMPHWQYVVRKMEGLRGFRDRNWNQTLSTWQTTYGRDYGTLSNYVAKHKSGWTSGTQSNQGGQQNITT